MRIPIDKCIDRRLYKIGCRNLVLGVFDGKTGFIGIREKFGSEFLFKEYHWDTGPPYGTVHDVEDTGIDVPSEIPIVEDLGTVDQATMRPVAFDRPVADGGRGWYFKDTNEASGDIRPVGVPNDALFKWLMDQELVLVPERRKQITDFIDRMRREDDEDVVG